jgi:hypothetical protein
MEHPSIRRLSATPLTRADGLIIELHDSSDSPAQILILWPGKPSPIAPNPVALSDVARKLVRAFGDAQTELARLIKDGGSRS